MERIEACLPRACLLGPQNHLRAAEERDPSPASLDTNRRIPDLRGAPQMHGRRAADDRAIARGAEEVGFELDGGEAARALRQARHAAVAAARVGERDARSDMQI